MTLQASRSLTKRIDKRTSMLLFLFFVLSRLQWCPLSVNGSSELFFLDYGLAVILSLHPPDS